MVAPSGSLRRRLGRRAGFGLLVLLALPIAAYAMAFALGRVPVSPDLLASHRERTWAFTLHTALGAIALLVGPWQFVSGIRRRALAVHRALGYVYVLAVLVSGSAGLLLALSSAEGLVTHLGFGALAAAWLATTGMAWRAIRTGEVDVHREWMTRSIALTYAAVTLRLLLPLLIVLTGGFGPGYRIVSWLCWVPNLVAAEWWIRRSRLRP